MSFSWPFFPGVEPGSFSPWFSWFWGFDSKTVQRSALCRSRRELPTSIYSQNLSSIQPRTSPKKFGKFGIRDFEISFAFSPVPAFELTGQSTLKSGNRLRLRLRLRLLHLPHILRSASQQNNHNNRPPPLSQYGYARCSTKFDKFALSNV